MAAAGRAGLGGGAVARGLGAAHLTSWRPPPVAGGWPTCLSPLEVSTGVSTGLMPAWVAALHGGVLAAGVLLGVLWVELDGVCDVLVVVDVLLVRFDVLGDGDVLVVLGVVVVLDCLGGCDLLVFGVSTDCSFRETCGLETLDLHTF